MIELPGAPAVSGFRIAKLRPALETIHPGIGAISARFIHFADVEGATEHLARAFLDLRAEAVERRAGRWRKFTTMSCRERGSRDDSIVSAIGLEAVTGRVYQIAATACGALAFVRHPDGFVHIGAEAAENAFGQVELDDALAGVVFATDRAGRTNGGSRARVFPVGPINLRSPARVERKLGRRGRILRRDDAG